MCDAPPALELRNVEHAYGGLRPLRLTSLSVPTGGLVTLLGFDQAAAQVFVNLVTGATLPEKGEVVSLARPTHAIADSEEWLGFVERFGIVSDRVVFLEAMTVAQNLAIPFSLELEPVPAEILAKVRELAAAVALDDTLLLRQAGTLEPLPRAKLRLARAMAMEPAVLLLEHPSASLSPADAREYATVVARAAGERRLTVVTLTMDEGFAKTLGGRVLRWQPATGDLREEKRWWRF